MMRNNSTAYAGLLSIILSGCVSGKPAPLFPSQPFRIEGYLMDADQKPGSYDHITIGNRTYCYFWKTLKDGNDLIIYDGQCDLDGDRIIILSKDGVVLARDTKDIKKGAAQKLDGILLNH